MTTLFLCGDVMTGRGIDQIQAHPSDPGLHEPYVSDAREYVLLAEQANGPLPRVVDPGYIWGDALAVWERLQPDARIINLETSVTRSDEYCINKEIHYIARRGSDQYFWRRGLAAAEHSRRAGR